MSDTDLMTAAELADRLKITVETVRAWYRAGRVPGHKYSHKVLRFRLDEVVAALETYGPAPPRGRRGTTGAAAGA